MADDKKKDEPISLLQAFRSVIYDEEFLATLSDPVRKKINVSRNRYEKQGKLGTNAMESIAQIRYNKQRESQWKIKPSRTKKETETE